MAEKDGVARATILAALANILFDVYSLDGYTASVLWDMMDQTHNTNSQGLEKYSVARFLEFQLVDRKSMIEQFYEFEMLVHSLGESGIVLPEKFRVMSEKHKSRQGHVMSAEQGEFEGECSDCMIGKKVGHCSKDHPNKKAKEAGVVAKTNTVLGLGTTSGHVSNMVFGRLSPLEPTTELIPKRAIDNISKCQDDPTHTSTSIPDHVEKMTNMGADPDSSSTPNEVQEPRRSKCAKVVKDFRSNFIAYNVEDEPLTFRQAMDSSESRNWKGFVQSEIDSVVSYGTRELFDLPSGCSTIGYKWIFKRKLNPDGSIDKYKARLVVKGFRQREGIDYFDTYYPIARMKTIRMPITLASPERFVASGNKRKVCRLVKSIYGLKQATIDWHKKFNETILDFEFLVNESDKCVYYKVLEFVGTQDNIADLLTKGLGHAIVLKSSYNCTQQDARLTDPEDNMLTSFLAEYGAIHWEGGNENVNNENANENVVEAVNQNELRFPLSAEGLEANGDQAMAKLYEFEENNNVVVIGLATLPNGDGLPNGYAENGGANMTKI
ncbi:hypothetical protein AgCh_040243 [Apium graveolens]